MTMNFSQPNKTHAALGANTSLETSNPWFTGDFELLTFSVTTGAAAASRITIVGSNADGFSSNLSSANRTVQTVLWSQLTATPLQGIFPITPIPRWVMAIRDTSTSGQTASNITVILTGIY